jgi:hypothetical protein
MQDYRPAATIVAALATDAAAGLPSQRRRTEAEKFAYRLARLVQRRTGGAIHDLQVGITPDGIFLHGRCAAFYLKQLAQEAVLAITEDQPLFNRIEVE